MSASLLALAALAPVFGQEAPAWVEAERGILERHVQLTREARFRKAGECYFSPDERQIVFQAVERRDDPAAEEPFYQMYVADLAFDGERVVGIEDVVRLSPPGSSNTCGWFHPTEPGVVLFASTIVPPKNPGKTGYQRESSRYSWQFPEEMDIVQVELARADGTAAPLERVLSNPKAYLAEASLSRDGRYLVHCEHQVDQGSSGGDLFAVDLASGRRVQLTDRGGYDGGPFFSPDGSRICYRSDRRGDDLLQVFVAELAFDAAGRLTGAAREFQVTDNLHVNWAPYWHPDGRHLVYTTSELGHENYEVFLIDADSGAQSGTTKYGTRRRRVTHAERFDGLPVFDGRGARLMWTCQRAGDGSSQVWLADFVLPLDRDTETAAEAAADASEPAGARPERLQVEDPDTGLFFLYDMATHRLTVYDPRTHQERAAEGAEIQRAMELFNAAGSDGE
jgi:hypothetical protein